MPVVLEALYLEELGEKDLLRGWVTEAIQNGRVFEGYSGNYYVHRKYGEAEIYACIVRDTERKENVFERFDIQVSGCCVWKVRLSGVGLKNDTKDDMTRLSMVNGIGGGFTVVDILNADVLPSYLEDDEIQMQVVAYAVDVYYYADDDAYSEAGQVLENSKASELNGKKIQMGMGTVLPTGFLNGHMIREDEDFTPDDDADEYVVVTGIVKTAYAKPVKFNDNILAKFIVVTIETSFGDLDIVHSPSMVSEEEFELIRPGAIIQAVAILSGDVAIYEYENGFVKDEKNDVAALRYAFMKGNAGRLSRILADDVIYESVNSMKTIKGKDNVISHIDYIHSETKIDYISFLATINNSEKEERCFVLAEDNEDNLTAVVRIQIGEEGMIKKIMVTDVFDVELRIDPRPQYDTILPEGE